MAGWNGSGIFTKTYSWVADAANGIKIRADRHDQNDTDFTNGINNCLTKDGQNTPTANLPMGTYKHTGVGDATARTQYLTLGQFQDNDTVYMTTTGTANAYVATPSPAISAYSTGQRFNFKISATNTGSSTVNISALGTKSIRKQGALHLDSGDLVADRIYEFIYDGTNFQVLNSSPQPEIIQGFHATPKKNEVPLNGSTIAMSSGATFNGSMYRQHYEYLWNNVADGQAAVSGGRGVSAAADFAANKTITTPDFRDRAMVGVSSGGSFTAVATLSGATTVTPTGTVGTSGATTLTTDQMPSHTHTTPQGWQSGGTTSTSGVWGTGNVQVSTTSGSTGGGNSHTHSGGSLSMNASSVLQKSVGIYYYLRA